MLVSCPVCNEQALKEIFNLQEHLGETTIIVSNETEQQVFYSFQYFSIHTENYTLQDSSFMIVTKN